MKRDWNRDGRAGEMLSLNDSIGILQSGYGRAINKANKWSGRLFKDNCQAKDGWINVSATISKNGRLHYRFRPGNDYAYQCFSYIHNNPVKAGLVVKAIDYLWSSARDYAGFRKETICNLEMGKQLRDFL